MQRYKRILLVVLPILILLVGGAAYATINLSSQKPTQHQSLKPGINIDQGEKGLVGWWRLNGNAKDSTPYSNDGKINGGGVTPTTDRKGTPNGAYAFAGGTNRITLPDTRSDFSADEGQALTVSIWMKTGTPAANQELFWHQDGCVGWNMEIRPTGALYFINTIGTNCSDIKYYQANSPTTGPNYGDNTWHLVTGVVNRPAGTISIYVDGVLIKSSSIPTTGPSLDLGPDFFIGNAYASVSPFIGSLSDARVYNRALSAGEIQNLYNSYNSQVNLCTTGTACTVNLTAGLIGYWPFNGNANDATPHQDNGIVTNATLTPNRFGTPNSAYYFNGTNAVITLANNLPQLNAYTISLWCNSSQNDIGDSGDVFDTFGNNRRYLRDISNGIMQTNQYDAGGSPHAINALGATYGAWHFWTVTWDGAKMKLYEDGTLQNTAAVSTMYNWGFGRDTIGARNTNNLTTDFYFKGSIDELRIYSRPLSAAEIQALYNLPD